MSGLVVVLSGGGGRALAHLGVLEVLEQEQVPIRRIVGVSAGAVAGALFARYGAREAQARLVELLQTPDLQAACGRIARIQAARGTLRARLQRLIGYGRLVRRPGIVGSHHMLRAMGALFGSTAFQDLPIPLSVVTTDVNEAREVVLGSGPLMTALAGTCAFPGIVEPVRAGHRLLVDSGDVNPLPVHVARRYRPRFTLAVDVSRGKIPPPAQLNGIEVAARSRDAAAIVLREVQRGFADFLIRPRILRREWTDYSEPEEAFRVGRAAARRRLDRLRAGLQWKEVVRV